MNYLWLTGAGENVDRAFRIAIGDITGNIGLYQGGLLEQTSPSLLAGLAYDTPWTRDAAFNSWYAGFIAPEAVRNSLLSALRRNADGTVLIGEEFGQYWDQIIWAAGAWHDFLHSGDLDFLAFSLEVIENSLKHFRQDEMDEKDGLFRGGACFQDGISAYPDRFISTEWGSGIADWLKHPPAGACRAEHGGGLPMKALSTNCLYLEAYRIADRMRGVLGQNPCHQAEADKLRAAIRQNFFDCANRKFCYLVDAGDNTVRQEGLGVAFALLTDVLDENEARAVIAGVQRTSHGIPCIWPPYERYIGKPSGYPRHSGTIWPHVNAAWCCALMKYGVRTEALHELQLLAKKAVRDCGFYELYHPDTGLPYGGLQESGRAAGMVEWPSGPRQTWAATGFIRMTLSVLFGVCEEIDRLTFAPFLADGCGQLTLGGFRWRGMELSITAKPGVRAAMTVNGNPAEAVFPGIGKHLDVQIEIPRLSDGETRK